MKIAGEFLSIIPNFQPLTFNLQHQIVMATVERFEDLEIWQLARTLVGMVYEITNNNDFAKDYGLKDQIRRSSVSIMNNIAEDVESRTVTCIAHNRIF